MLDAREFGVDPRGTRGFDGAFLERRLLPSST